MKSQDYKFKEGELVWVPEGVTLVSKPDDSCDGEDPDFTWYSPPFKITLKPTTGIFMETLKYSSRWVKIFWHKEFWYVKPNDIYKMKED
jgi:hypothetical protein